MFLKLSTAATIMFGPFVDKTDGITLKTDATTITDIDHATTGIFLSKAGGTAAVRHQSVTASVADAYGMMKVTLDTTDTNTVGTLDVLFAKAATYIPVFKRFQVIPAIIYDSLFAAAATDYLVVDVVQWNGTAVSSPSTAGIPEVNIKNIANAAVSTSTAQLGVNAVQAGATAWGSGAITAASIATGAITNAKFAAGAIDAAAIANGAIDNATFAADVGSTAGATNIIALAVDKSLELAKVPKSDSAVSWNATALAAINAEVDTALNTAIPASNTANSVNDVLLDQIAVKTGYLPAATAGNAGGVFIAGTNAATTVTTALTTTFTGNLTGSVASVANIAPTGTGLSAIPWNAAWDAEVQSEVDDALVAQNLDHLLKLTTATADMSNECIDGTVMSRLLSKTSDTSSFNPTTDSLEAIRDKLPTNLEDMSITDTTGLVDITQTAADKVWGTAARVLTANTNLSGLEVDLTKIHGTAITETAGQLAAAFTKFFDVAAPTGTVNSLPGAAPDAAGGLPISDAGGLDMDAVKNVLTATLAELSQGIPPSTPTISQAIMLLYMNLRNLTLTTETEYGIHNDAGTKIAKATLSDNGTTFSKGELASGA